MLIVGPPYAMSRVGRGPRAAGVPRSGAGSSPASTATRAAARTGRPGGSEGVVTSAMKAAATAIATASADSQARPQQGEEGRGGRGIQTPRPGGRRRTARRRPRPGRTGSRRHTPTRRPPRTLPAAPRSSLPEAARAADSSMVSCTRASPFTPCRGRERARISPYRVFRTPSSTEARAAPRADPPPPITPMNANWLPPVNITAESTIACQTSSPEEVARAPKEIPYRPVASPIENPVRRILRTGSTVPGASWGVPGEAVVMMVFTVRSPGRTLPSCPVLGVRS